MSLRPVGWRRGERGELKFGWGCLLWLFGVPLPILLVIYLLQHC